MRPNRAAPNSREEFYRQWIETEVLPLLPAGSSIAEVRSGDSVSIQFSEEKPTEAQIARVRRAAGVSDAFMGGWYNDKLQVFGTTQLQLESLVIGRKPIRLRLIALLANPKTLELIGVYQLGQRTCLIGSPVVAGELDLNNPARLLVEGERARHSEDIIGIGYLGDPKGGDGSDRLVDGCIRAHCPAGVSIKEQAYGTCLYVGLACLAALEFNTLCVGSAPESDQYGPRSSEADKWWADNVQDRRSRPALAEEVEIDLNQDEEEDYETGTYEFSSRQKSSIEEAIESEIDTDGWDGVRDIEVPGEIEYSYTLYREEKSVEGVAGVLKLKNAIDQGLVLWLSDTNKTSEANWSSLDAYVGASYEDHLDRFKNLDPQTTDESILNLLREILVAGGISEEELVAWEALHGIGGAGTEYMFPPGSARVSERGLSPKQLRAKGQPRRARSFEQQVLPNRSGRRQQLSSEAERRKLVAPWLDDDS